MALPYSIVQEIFHCEVLGWVLDLQKVWSRRGRMVCGAPVYDIYGIFHIFRKGCFHGVRAEEGSIPQPSSAKIYSGMSEDSDVIANLIVGNGFEVAGAEMMTRAAYGIGCVRTLARKGM